MSVSVAPVAPPGPPLPAPPGRRYALIVTLLALALAIVVVVVTLSVGGGGQPTARFGAASQQPSVPSVPSAPVVTGPVPVPAHGALFGAWVHNGDLSQAGRVSAVTGLEGAIGRKLDIVNTYRRFEEPFPTSSDRDFAAGGRTLMLSWVINDTQDTAAGRDDPALRDWAARLRDFGYPLLVRLRWEMDRPNLRAAMHSGSDYVAAWQHVRGVFAGQGVTNVSWVWCPTIDGFEGGYASDFYPGDDQVDWLCVDAYAGSRMTRPADLLRPFFSWAAGHRKPIVVGEYGVAVAWGGTARSEWLAEAAAVFQGNPQVKAACYFDSDPDGNGPYRQYHLGGDPQALAAFAAMGSQGYFHTR